MSTYVEVAKNCSIIEARVVNSRSEPVETGSFSPNQTFFRLFHGYSMRLTLKIGEEEREIEYLILDMERTRDGRMPAQAKVRHPSGRIDFVREQDGVKLIGPLAVSHQKD